MRRSLIWASVLAISLMMAIDSQADTVFFDFQDAGVAGSFSGEIDGGGVGAVQVGDLQTGTLNTTLTTVDILAPEFAEDANGVFFRTGNTLSAAAGDGGTTNINAGQAALAINNPSISNNEFDNAEGLVTGGNEANDFNTGESWVFTFDQIVTLTNIEVESFEPTNVLEVFVDGVLFETFIGINGVTAFSNNAEIAAGSEITFAASGDLADTDFRIESLTVDTVAAAAPANYDVYIIAGQSNADGRALESDLPSGSPLAGVQSNAIISYINPGEPNGDVSVNSGGFVPLRPGFSVAPGEDRSAGVPSGTNYFGLELSFAASIGSATGSNNPIAIIKVTRGGTSLRADWRVGDPAEPGVATGFLYTALLSHIQSSLDELTDNGNTANIKGFLWHQGEGDSNSTSSYAERFTDLVEGVRNQFGADIPVVLGELSQTRDNSGPLNIVFNDFVNNSGVPNVGLVSSTGITTPADDTSHFDANGQMILGERYATAIAALASAPIMLGDVDLSGRVDFLDIGPFIALLSSGGFQEEADIDGSDVVDFLDIGPFIAILSAP